MHHANSDARFSRKIIIFILWSNLYHAFLTPRRMEFECINLLIISDRKENIKLSTFFFLIWHFLMANRHFLKSNPSVYYIKLSFCWSPLSKDSFSVFCPVTPKQRHFVIAKWNVFTASVLRCGRERAWWSATSLSPDWFTHTSQQGIYSTVRHEKSVTSS